MRAGGVLVREVTAQRASEVPFVAHDDVIEAFPPNRPDDALGEGILPRRSGRDEGLARPQALHPPCERDVVDGVTITEERYLGALPSRQLSTNLLARSFGQRWFAYRRPGGGAGRSSRGRDGRS
jgi:hypothetical protein